MRRPRRDPARLLRRPHLRALLPLATNRPEHHIKVAMMCRPEERDLRHAARRALAEARADGRGGEARLEAATDAVAAVWAHVDREAIRAAVEAEAVSQDAPWSLLPPAATDR